MKAPRTTTRGVRIGELLHQLVTQASAPGPYCPATPPAPQVPPATTR